MTDDEVIFIKHGEWGNGFPREDSYGMNEKKYNVLKDKIKIGSETEMEYNGCRYFLVPAKYLNGWV